MPSDFLINTIDSKVAMDMVVNHHYSRRKVGSKASFGLFEQGKLVGCAVYSQPASYTLCRGVCGPEFSKHVIELARVVVITKTKNAASFLVGNSLKMLGDAIVVSYADCNDHVGHVGYIYQSTNWTYTGRGNSEPVWIHPKTKEVVSYTRRHIDKKAEAIGLSWKELERRPQVGKYRYVFFSGTKKFRKTARQNLRYKEQPYPKGETRRHCSVQSEQMLFD